MADKEKGKVQKGRGFTLRVAEAGAKDVGRGVARIDPTDMEKLGVAIGDVIVVSGKAEAVAKLMPTYMEERGKKIVQIDGVLRDNAKVGIGEKAVIKKAQCADARRIVLKPLQAAIRRDGEEEYLGRLLEGLPTRRGNTVRAVLFGSRSRDFEVASTEPDGIVIITPRTTISMKGEPSPEVERRSSEISYEDVGGLEREIQRIREMIELPLKYPEVFDRLGIDAPKGVLLYGPPGTGKTLIARAVAHEAEATFYSINGPEIVHKFYGESLPGDELVLILRNGSFERMPIADIVASQDDSIQVPCFNRHGRLCFGKVKGFIAHPFRGRLMNLKTASGRSIRATDDHSLFTLSKNGIESIPTSRLEVGKSFVAVPKLLPFNPHSVGEINLLSLLMDDPDVVLRGDHVEEIMRRSIDILGIERCSQLLGFSEEYVREMPGRHIGVRCPDFLKLANAAKLAVKAENVTLSTIKRTKGISGLMKLDEDMCSFFGWWFAEGSYSRDYGVRMSVNSSESDYIVSLCERLFGRVTVYRCDGRDSVDVYINSAPLVKAMRAMGFKSGARNKSLPGFIYNLSRNNMAVFLRGYFSGDGSVNSTTPAPQVEVSTSSGMLADGICHLLLCFGIVAKVYDKVSEQSKRICFADSKNLKRFLEIGFVDPDRNAIIKRYLATDPSSRRDRLPLDVIRDDLGWRGDAWDGLVGIGVDAARKNVESLPPQLVPALDGDIYWDRVVAVEELPDRPEFVYDISVDPEENFISGFGGIFAHNSEQHLRQIFEKAASTSPSIIFIDEIDAIAPKRAEVTGDVEKRIVATLLAQLDGLKSRGQIIVIGATNIPEVIDPALRRPGRFDREIRIGIPDRNGREQILDIHTRGMPLAEGVDISRLAEITHGYVGADLEALAREAAMICLREVLSKTNVSLDEIPIETFLDLEVTHNHFMEALKEVEPSAIREVFVEIPNVKWDDVGGLDDVKRVLKEAIQWPLSFAPLFEAAKAVPSKGILLEGPPGTGKTLIAKALANESGVNFISIKGPEMMSKWVGEAEKAVRQVFQRAKAASPCIIFFDELDSIVPSRGGGDGDSGVTQRVLSQFLTEMDGIEELKGVVVLGATNRPDLIDPALLRTGRFDFVLSMPVPDRATRKKIFEVHTRGRPMSRDIDFESLIERTDGMVGSDIEALCRRAVMVAIREFIEKHKQDANSKRKNLSITSGHFEKAFKEIQKEGG